MDKIYSGGGELFICDKRREMTSDCDDDDDREVDNGEGEELLTVSRSRQSEQSSSCLMVTLAVLPFKIIGSNVSILSSIVLND